MLANGRLVEAEAALREAERLSVELYGAADRTTITDFGRLASAVALQGRYDAARAMLDERQALLQTMQTDEARAALLVIRGRRLENEMLRGRVQTAAAYVGPADPAALANVAIRDAEVFLGYEAQWLVWSGRAGEAVDRLAAVLQRLKPAQRWGPAGFRIAAVEVQARLASAQNAEAGKEASALIAAMRDAAATRTWTYQAAVEMAALAQVRTGHAGEAAATLSGLDATAPKVRAPSPIDDAESLLRRAEVYRGAGKGEEAAAAARRALVLLTGQDAQSPRLIEANRLLAAPPAPG